MRTVEARAVTATIEKTVVEVMEAVGMVRVAVVEMASVWRWGRKGGQSGDGNPGMAIRGWGNPGMAIRGWGNPGMAESV